MKRKKTIRLLIIVICLYLAFTTLQGTVKLFSSGEKVTRREKVLAGLVKENNNLKRKEREVSGPGYLDEVAYDKLGMAMPGEKVFIIPEELLKDNSPKIVVVNEPNWQKWVELIL